MSLTTKAKSVLVLGGARSGKSSYAEQLVLSSGLSAFYVATGQAFDEEMRTRIEAHKSQRAGQGWMTLEEPLGLPLCLAKNAKEGRVLLVDCLTLWLSNLMHSERNIDEESDKLIQIISSSACPLIFVSNEVGLSIVPENALARRFRDEAGRLNQKVAEACDTVVFVAAGQALQLKPNNSPEIRL
ncbi:bifunctional adenosylcobinamide kinase/adenosylcobinamide-phosphate guanylyltransferase [Flexibacterium corallicola]|uniref:bifunctional adenosylcobinamide kinase/adenosylcobinamide-phosphate guanylyltransferase n=1 Tax=Flexibacterium corallicola TaxID=3037259 RepID=UPI00286FA1B7|nr:bifunctional adenosylcobinamide kinase/adenosylcobinamide-phosphate guanylyltransferase [Pseudovibrio sp. M1P-2-3]